MFGVGSREGTTQGTLNLSESDTGSNRLYCNEDLPLTSSDQPLSSPCGSDKSVQTIPQSSLQKLIPASLPLARQLTAPEPCPFECHIDKVVPIIQHLNLYGYISELCPDGIRYNECPALYEVLVTQANLLIRMNQDAAVEQLQQSLTPEEFDLLASILDNTEKAASVSAGEKHHLIPMIYLAKKLMEQIIEKQNQLMVHIELSYHCAKAFLNLLSKSPEVLLRDYIDYINIIHDQNVQLAAQQQAIPRSAQPVHGQQQLATEQLFSDSESEYDSENTLSATSPASPVSEEQTSPDISKKDTDSLTASIEIPILSPVVSTSSKPETPESSETKSVFDTTISAEHSETLPIQLRLPEEAHRKLKLEAHRKLKLKRLEQLQDILVRHSQNSCKRNTLEELKLKLTKKQKTVFEQPNTPIKLNIPEQVHFCHTLAQALEADSSEEQWDDFFSEMGRMSDIYYSLAATSMTDLITELRTV
ncbi:MAG: hypothetical protein ACR2PX_19625 [Endozoicomonas sp.]|uniref:hypothetical protein n=1 Tax=Endozoicomonas sp. TaxID=1892382 RepID=UPI003D9AF5BA